MVLSMNTLPKYDIADIVSHISGEMQPADAQDAESSEGHSFADLLRSAIKSIPESNAEVNVAESGKTLPQSPLTEKDMKSQSAAEGFSENELHDLFRQALSGDSQESVPEVSVGAAEVDRSELEFQENSDLLANLRAAIKFRSSEKAEIDSVKRESVISHSNAGIKLANLSQENADERIRIATLKERRPVILGPGSYSDELKSQVMANYFSDERFLTAQLDGAAPSAENFKEKTNQLEGKNETGAGLKSNFADTSLSADQFSLRKAEADFTNKEVKKSSASIAKGSPEHINLPPSDGRQTGLEGQYQNFQGQPELDNKGKPIKEAPNTNGSTQEDALSVRSSRFSQSESGLEEVQSRGLNLAVQSTKEFESKKHAEEFRSQTPQVDALRIDENQTLSNGADKEDLKGMFFSKDPQDFDPKIGAYLEEAEELKSVKSQPLVDTVGRSLTPDNVVRQSQIQPGIAKQNISIPAGDLESHWGLESDIEGEFENNELKQGFRVENFDTTRNSLRAGRIESGIQIQIEGYSKSSGVDKQMFHPADVDSTAEGSDPSIKTPNGEKTDALRPELLASLQSDKTIGPNRIDLTPRNVAVSNFSSGVQEAIMGQLSRTSAGTSKFTVALFPENLGKISIEISYSDLTGLKITMIGDNPEATKILEQNLPVLRENLQTDKLNELLVNLNTNKDSSGTNQKHGQSGEGSFAGNEDKDVGTMEPTSSKPETYDKDDASDSETGLDTYV